MIISSGRMFEVLVCIVVKCGSTGLKTVQQFEWTSSTTWISCLWPGWVVGGPTCSEWVGGSSWHSAVGGDCKSSRKLPVSCDVCCLICTLNVIQYFKALKYLNLHTHIYTLVDSFKKMFIFSEKKKLPVAQTVDTA